MSIKCLPKPQKSCGQHGIIRKDIPYGLRPCEITRFQVFFWSSLLICFYFFQVKYYELPKNPAVIAGPLGQHNADEMLFWTKEEYMRFIPTMANKTYSYMAFEMLYWCGLRMGELLALTPAVFDFDRNNVSITKSYQRIKGEDVITKPKTKKSVRVIKMPEMVAILKDTSRQCPFFFV